MGKKLDLTGQRFGMLRALECVGLNKRHQRRWRCICDCGRVKVIQSHDLRKSGGTKSCGCLRHRPNLRNLTHGQSNTAEYRIWRGMWTRCSNPSSTSFKHYGSRGIKVCDRWSIFETFFADMGARPSPDHTIERVNNERGYSPDNCVWETQLAQQNNKSTTRWISHDGRTQSLTFWVRETGIGAMTIKYRIDHGWTPERALTKPAGPNGRRRASMGCSR